MTFALTPKEQKWVKTLKAATIEYLSPFWFTPFPLATAPSDMTYWQWLLPEQDRDESLYIVIPTLWLVAPIVTVPEGSRDYITMIDGKEIDINSYLVDGVMHYPGSSFPGEEGNMIVFGHSNFYKKWAGRYKTIFADIMQLDVWVDELWVYEKQEDASYKRFIYSIEQSYETHPTDVAILQPRWGKEITVFACTNGLAGRWIVKWILQSSNIWAVAAIEKNSWEQSMHNSVPPLFIQRMQALQKRFMRLPKNDQEYIRDTMLVAIEYKRIAAQKLWWAAEERISLLDYIVQLLE